MQIIKLNTYQSNGYKRQKMSEQLDLFEVLPDIKEEPKILKKCNRCNIELPAEEMVRDKNCCKPCKKIQDDNRRKESRKFLFNFYLSHPCIDCGETNPFVLQLDHLTDKHKNISDMVSSRHCIESIKKEIEKCVVRCSNCHAKKTAKDQKWYKEHYDHEKGEIIKDVDDLKKDDSI